mmetsp:Transcript_91068/g.278780  ORF Transcript_91068/g.278780 Transcript_91068/m.278780 type:complete len:214 (+) Transcript_91068:3023-3664(+)
MKVAYLGAYGAWANMRVKQPTPLVFKASPTSRKRPVVCATKSWNSTSVLWKLMLSLPNALGATTTCMVFTDLPGSSRGISSARTALISANEGTTRQTPPRLGMSPSAGTLGNSNEYLTTCLDGLLSVTSTARPGKLLYILKTNASAAFFRTTADSSPSKSASISTPPSFAFIAAIWSSKASLSSAARKAARRWSKGSVFNRSENCLANMATSP